MPLMSVTLDVSRLSGWLNADANCRVAPRHVEGDTGGGKRIGGWGLAVHGGTDCWARHARGGAHVKHVCYGRDAGRVEAQRLVKRRRALPSHTEARGGLAGAWEVRGCVGAVWWCTQRARSSRLDTGHSTRAGVRT